ncbi:hypothetical protein [Deinococcus multiflagellatus]|uniref:Helix-hairpin-helix domain-containing protein n=1 Tax=Deinococcus multiflagellatus TaxID=1656887 RepID=A0ABW1ZEX3_9DEIO|nr:hypothetical protein [Deinococcus multiflagellatus]MBZ9712184.1 hypothetical protein [Deinococcus multiflagellatus]
MTQTVKVTELARTYTKNGERFGPFKATAEQPFLEVPAAIAMASGAPVYDGEAAEPDAGADVEDLLQANRDLKADLDKSDAELGAVLDAMGWVPGQGIAPADLIRNIKGGAETNRQLLDQAQVRILELERETGELRLQVTDLQALVPPLESEAAPDQGSEAQGDSTGEPSTEPDAPATGTPLPDDIAFRTLLLDNGFDTMEKLEAGLKVAEGQTESPVQQINGIGGKTVKAYQQLLADRKAQQ